MAYHHPLLNISVAAFFLVAIALADLGCGTLDTDADACRGVSDSTYMMIDIAPKVKASTDIAFTIIESTNTSDTYFRAVNATRSYDVESSTALEYSKH
ncbi:MAG: hypothetical protein ACPG7F_13945 [Aggregatilineales bacterium]